MSAPVYGALSLDAPFPGLRPFEAEESLLFYGREVHVAELLERLGDSHFVAVIGTSGSGKSSLVRAGLRPALQRGYLIDATSRWRFATMRPGGSPIQAMALALTEAFEGASIEDISKPLRGTSAGLSEAVKLAGLAAGESVLIIADQFEELFRFDATPAQQGEAALFVSQLLEATERRTSPVYVVVTMRSEFLGRCSEFPGLAEAFNRSQYLVPRLTFDERRQAVERPLRLFGTEPAPALVQQVLNDAGDDPDQLPVMQHVLLRTFRAWERSGSTGRIDRVQYEAVGQIEGAIDRHGEDILSTVNGGSDLLVERLFRSLTVTQGGVSLRRPRRLERLYAICGASTPDQQKRLRDIITAFADRQNAFLMLSKPELNADTIVDITHESVIRKWKRLTAWVREESRSAEWYADLARDVVRRRAGAASLWQDPELSGILQRRRLEEWNEAWANQYRRDDDPAFADVTSFLDESAAEQQKRQRAEDEQRNRELQQAKALARLRRRQSIFFAVAGFGLLAVVGAALWRERGYSSQLRDYQQRLTTLTEGIIRQQQASQGALEAERKRLMTSGNTSNAARLQQLTSAIEAAKAQVQGNQTELSKLRQDQQANVSDRGRLVSQIDTLQQQLTATRAERDKLQAQLSTPPPPNGDDVTALKKQLNDERTRANDATSENARLKTDMASLRNGIRAPVSINGTADDLERVFADGVGEYELSHFDKAAANMWTTIAMRPNVAQPRTTVPLSGSKTVQFTPAAYLAVALMGMKADCSAVAAALKSAESEPAPTRIGEDVKKARTKCGSK